MQLAACHLRPLTRIKKSDKCYEYLDSSGETNDLRSLKSLVEPLRRKINGVYLVDGLDRDLRSEEKNRSNKKALFGASFAAIL